MTQAALNASDRAVARSEITEILHRYTSMAREDADFPAMADLFTEDGVFVLPGGVEVPRTEIHRIAEAAPPRLIRHHVTTIDIRFHGDDSAETESFFIAYSDLVQPDHWGRWRDRFRRTPAGHWLLTRKEPLLDGYSPGGYLERTLTG